MILRKYQIIIILFKIIKIFLNLNMDSSNQILQNVRMLNMIRKRRKQTVE